MNTPAPTPTAPVEAAPAQAGSLVRVVALGLLVGAAAALFATLDRAPWRAEPPAAARPSAVPTALPPIPKEETAPSVVTASGEVSPAGVAALVDSIAHDGPVADPGGRAPKPRDGALFHRMVDGTMTLRVYKVNGTPEAVMTSFAKDLEKAGFEAEDGEAKPNARGRIRRVYTKDTIEVLVTVGRGAGDQATHTLVTMVEQPRRDAS